VAEWSIATDCKSVAQWASQVQILPYAQMKNNKQPDGLRTWIEIDRRAINHNYKTLRGLLQPETKYMAVVKSNAYGHNFIDFSLEVERLGADWIGVDSILEAEALREAGVKVPIFVLGLTLPSKLEMAADIGVSISVSSFEILDALRDFKRQISIHIKADTGMHRQGFESHLIPEVMDRLKKLPINVRVEGLFTHFASAKNPDFPDHTKNQIAEFTKWREAFFAAGFVPIVHAGASAGGILYPEAHFDMVRFGVSMYGLWPSAEAREHAGKIMELVPVLSWRTIIGEVKMVKKGETVGYDSTEALTRDSLLAVCPIGYWHGMPRALSSVGEVLVNGKRAKIIGRVSMDMITIDVTDCNAAFGDTVTLIGHDGHDEVTAEELAAHAKTSAYEIVTRLNPLIKRIMVG
jgi:alanine racemase